MKGKSPHKSAAKTVKQGKASPSASQQSASTTGAEGKKNSPNKVRKLVYRHGGKNQSPISVQQAAQAVLMHNLKGQSGKTGSANEGGGSMSVQQAAEAVVMQNIKPASKGKKKAISTETGTDLESKPDNYTGKKIIKSLPDEPHVQEVQREDGNFNYMHYV